jgi:hypothetical protein
MKRGGLVTLAFPVCLGGCGAASEAPTGCDAYVQAVATCLEHLGVPPGENLEQRVGCNKQREIEGADEYYQCLADVINQGSCRLDGRPDPLLYLSRDAATCHPRQIKGGPK